MVAESNNNIICYPAASSAANNTCKHIFSQITYREKKSNKYRPGNYFVFANN